MINFTNDIDQIIQLHFTKEPIMLVFLLEVV